MRVKLEINCREHSSAMGFIHHPYKVQSEWFSGDANIRTYSLSELLGTKLRALYQRSKGRDLFDLDYARRSKELDLDEIIYCFRMYIESSTKKRPPSKKEFLQNLEVKEKDPNFTGDIEGILRPEIKYNQQEAFDWLKTELIDKL